MSTQEPDQKDFSAFNRLVLALYPSDKDGEQLAVTLVILRGHLVVEEHLISMFESSLPHPEFLNKVRLSFRYLIYLTKAVKYHQENSWVWDALAKLNEVRNAIAHRSEPSKLDAKLEAFLLCIEIKQPPDQRGKSDKDKISRLKGALFYLTGVLDSIQRA